MDSPRGRVYQMVQVANGAPITRFLPRTHRPLPGLPRLRIGVPVGRALRPHGGGRARRNRSARASRAGSRANCGSFVFGTCCNRARALSVAGTLLYLYEVSGLKALVRGMGHLKLLGRLGDLEQLAPSAEPPFFFSQIGRTFPPEGERRHRVAFLAGCIANVAFARLNEATVRVLQRNGCEVVVPEGQGCCGALHLHAGMRERGAQTGAPQYRRRARAAASTPSSPMPPAAAPLSRNTASCSDDSRSTPTRRARVLRARCATSRSSSARIELNPKMGRVDAVVTYQDSCHLAHGQHVRTAPRQLLRRDSGTDVPRNAGRRSSAAAAPASTTSCRTRCRCRFCEHKMESVNATQRRRSSPPPTPAACCSCRPASGARQRPARHARGGSARPGLQERKVGRPPNSPTPQPSPAPLPLLLSSDPC